MQSFEQQRTGIRDEFPILANRYSKAARRAKLAVVILSAVSGVAQFAHFPANNPLDLWNWAGIISTVAVLVAGTMILIQEPDAAKNLIKTHNALETAADEMAKAREGQRKLAELDRAAGDESRRLVHLFSAVDTMRSYIDQSLEEPPVSDDEAVMLRTMLEMSARSIVLSHGFETKQDYTICIFRAEDVPTTNRKLLVCCAHIRAIPCQLDETRKWKEGVGIAGAAYSREDEIVLADLTAPELRTYYDLQSQARPNDVVKYRSIIAVPIWSDGTETEAPWGVAVATTDQVRHFTPDDRRNGDGTRALAAMVGFALKMQKYRPEGLADPEKSPGKA